MTWNFRKPHSLLIAALVLGAALVGAGIVSAQTAQYMDDGAIPNANGGWDLPPQGTCPADATKTTRPDCLALRLTTYTTSADCTAAATGGANRSWSTGVCNDLINTTQAACELQADRLWNNGVCAIVMKGDDRNNVVCALHGGTWVTSGACTGNWIMPARTAYTPTLLTGTGPGDQCLRCHNAKTEYNGPRVRDTENFLYTGHKNMARKVAGGKPWGGPPFACSNASFTDEQTCEANGFLWNPTTYPSDDSGNPFSWASGQITVSGVARDLTWIYGDWLAPLPRAIYKAPASASTVCSDPRGTAANCVSTYGGTLINNAGAAYSCARCHTTGWTSDAAINTATDINGKEPELSFPGITWDRNSNAPANVVNLSGGVTGDPNKYASWDVWGISCTRCHNSAINTASGTGTPAQYSAPTGMSTHHNNLTAPDASSGVCSDTRFTAEAQCTAAGGSWITACSVNPTAAVCTMAANTQAKCGAVAGTWTTLAGWCSNAFYADSTSCAANGFTWQDGWCSTADAQGACTGGTGDGAKTWRLNGRQESCQIAGATWSFSKCSVEGACNKNPGVNTTPAACSADGGQWAYATDIVRCLDLHEYGKENGIATLEAAKWTGNNTNRGQIITRLCMDCHRQETGGLPYNNAAATAGTDLNAVNPGNYVKVGPAHGTVAPVSHPHGNQFLNSPHARFTGSFNQIATAKQNAGYKSYFMMDGEAANTGNGCTGCHDVHESVVPETSPRPAIREECTECHAGPYAKDLTKMLHPTGPGTPAEHMATKPWEACITCHMPEGLHLFRINPSGAYSTFPAAAFTSTVNANTAPDGTFTNAVWVDVDHACGQCHGGGNLGASGTAATIAKSATTFDVQSLMAGSFMARNRIKIPGGGALESDGTTREDLETYISAVGACSPISATCRKLTVVGGPSVALSNVVVTQNPTRNGASYKSKATLAAAAAGIHSGAAAPSSFAMFSATLDLANPLKVNVDASASTCAGSASNCNSYTWSWGDGTADGSGVTANHTYAASGTYTITLAVEQTGVSGASGTKNVTVYAPDGPPTESGTCTFDAYTWTETVTDTSTDNTGIKQVTVNWGDGSVLSNDTSAPFGPFTHTYLNPAPTAAGFTITKKVIDTAGQQTSKTCTAAPAYFTISGTVFAKNGTTPITTAMVQLRKGTTLVKTVYTTANGTFTAANLKPGTYTLTVTKSGYTFAAPAATLTVGPSSAGNTFSATAP